MCKLGVVSIDRGIGASLARCMMYENNIEAESVFINFNITYPAGYEGPAAVDGALVDADGDGLSMTQELQQGSSDNAKDTDGDGIDDLKESQWYADRDEVFCDTISTPYICAYPNPTKKDLYVEIDWMNDGIRNYKPTPGQLNRVVEAFADQHIIAHIDTGAFGGGEQLAAPTGDLYFTPTDDEVDFYDLKNGTSATSPTFAPIRSGIWHYMITSMDYMNYLDDTDGPISGSTGSSFAGDDDSIISIEKIEELRPFNIFNPYSQDIAIAGTIIHELGHNLCLSDVQTYQAQSSLCIYQGIDNESGYAPINNPDSYFNLESYESSMNYRYQLDKVDYSTGVNGSPYDHSDWYAVSFGMGDFVDSAFEWHNTETYGRGSVGRVNRLSRQEMIDAIQD